MTEPTLVERIASLSAAYGAFFADDPGDLAARIRPIAKMTQAESLVFALVAEATVVAEADANMYLLAILGTDDDALSAIEALLGADLLAEADSSAGANRSLMLSAAGMRVALRHGLPVAGLFPPTPKPAA